MIWNRILHNIFSGNALQRCPFLFVFLLFIASNLFAASLQLSLDRNRVYLGEAIVATVRVNGANDEANKPLFLGDFDAKVDYLGSRNQSQSSVTIINGKMTRNDFKGRAFIYQITPSSAGVFTIDKVVLNLPNEKIECAGASFEVVGVEARPDIETIIACTNRTILVDSPFKVSLSVLLRALPSPNEAIEPVWVDNPLHIQADFLNFPEIDGLKSPDPNKALGKFTTDRDRRGATFSINDYVERGFGGSLFSFNADPFKEIPIKFRIRPELIDRSGTNWWRYTMDFDYFPKSEGDYTFGPVSLKGSIITGANADGSARMAEVFVIGPAITVHVIPPPEEGRPEWYSGGVGRSLNLKASLDTTRCKVGDPLSLTLDMTGDMSADNIRPPILNLQANMTKDFRIYDDVIESESIPNGKRFRYRIRPLRAGTLELPAIKTAYYDTAKLAYVTVRSAPLPIQVDATTQIATEDNNVDDSENGFIPNGIILAKGEAESAYIPFLGSSLMLGQIKLPARLEWWLLPAIWLLIVLSYFSTVLIGSYKERTKFGRLAARELRMFRGASRRIRNADDKLILDAISALRGFVAATLGADNRSLTSREARTLLIKEGLDAEFVDSFSQDFARLEEIPYRKENDGLAISSQELLELLGRIENSMCALPDLLDQNSKRGRASDWRSFASIVVILFVTVSTAVAGTFERLPSDFDWERASSVMATARTSEDFASGAELYYAMVTNGAYSASLFYNLGTAMLMAESPRAAAQAFEISARWRGMSPELLGNQLAAEGLISASVQLPPERYFLIWHYGLPIQIRIFLLQLFWNLLWLFLIAFTVGAILKRRRVEHFTLPGAVITAIVVLLFLGSIAISYYQSLRPVKISAWEIDKTMEATSMENLNAVDLEDKQ